MPGTRPEKVVESEVMPVRDSRSELLTMRSTSHDATPLPLAPSSEASQLTRCVVAVGVTLATVTFPGVVGGTPSTRAKLMVAVWPAVTVTGQLSLVLPGAAAAMVY